MDSAILNFFNVTLANPLFDILMKSITLSIFWIVGVAAIVLIFRKQQRLGWAILTTMLVAVLLALLGQHLSNRPRPEALRAIWAPPSVPSYPSGHSSAAFALALLIGLYKQQRNWWIGSILLATLVAISRLYLGVHWPSDVLGGIILGISVGAAGFGLFFDQPGAYIRWRWLLWPQIALVLLATHMAYMQILPYHLLTWPYADKVFHFLLFGLVVFWLNLWLRGKSISFGKIKAPIAFVVPFTIAFVEEMLQYFSIARRADAGDLFSDLLGMLVFWYLSHLVLRRQQISRSGKDTAAVP